MSNFVPNSHHLREVLLHYFIAKKTEGHRILVKVYGEHALSETTCGDWFRRFKSGVSTSATKTVENHRKNLKMQNCRHCWTKNQLKP